LMWKWDKHKTQQTRHGLWWDWKEAGESAGESGVQAAVVLMLAAVAGGPTHNWVKPHHGAKFKTRMASVRTAS